MPVVATSRSIGICRSTRSTNVAPRVPAQILILCPDLVRAVLEPGLDFLELVGLLGHSRAGRASVFSLLAGPIYYSWVVVGLTAGLCDLLHDMGNRLGNPRKISARARDSGRIAPHSTATQ